MMDIDPKMHGTNDSLIIPSTIRGDLGAFASANISSASSGAGVNSVHGSQQLNSNNKRFDEDSNISLIKVGYPGFLFISFSRFFYKINQTNILYTFSFYIHIIQVVVLGAPGVGKTSIVKVIIHYVRLIGSKNAI